MELLRTEVSRLRGGGISSPDLGELRDWGFSCSGIGRFFHPLFPASGPWVRVESLSLLKPAFAEVSSLWDCCGEAGEEALPLWADPERQLLPEQCFKKVVAEAGKVQSPWTAAFQGWLLRWWEK